MPKINFSKLREFLSTRYQIVLLLSVDNYVTAVILKASKYEIDNGKKENNVSVSAAAGALICCLVDAPKYHLPVPRESDEFKIIQSKHCEKVLVYETLLRELGDEIRRLSVGDSENDSGEAGHSLPTPSLSVFTATKFVMLRGDDGDNDQKIVSCSLDSRPPDEILFVPMISMDIQEVVKNEKFLDELVPKLGLLTRAQKGMPVSSENGNFETYREYLKAYEEYKGLIRSMTVKYKALEHVIEDLEVIKSMPSSEIEDRILVGGIDRQVTDVVNGLVTESDSLSKNETILIEVINRLLNFISSEKERIKSSENEIKTLRKELKKYVQA